MKRKKTSIISSLSLDPSSLFASFDEISFLPLDLSRVTQEKTSWCGV